MSVFLYLFIVETTDVKASQEVRQSLRDQLCASPLLSHLSFPSGQYTAAFSYDRTHENILLQNRFRQENVVVYTALTK